MSYMIAPAYPVDPPVFLQPRPLALYPGSFVLLPLLPKRPALKPLPAELWSKVFTFVFMGEQGRKVDATERRRVMRSNWKIMFVCKRWMVRPLSKSGYSQPLSGNPPKHPVHAVWQPQYCMVPECSEEGHLFRLEKVWLDITMYLTFFLGGSWCM